MMCFQTTSIMHSQMDLSFLLKKDIQNITIVGAGLMGASIAKVALVVEDIVENITVNRSCLMPSMLPPPSSRPIRRRCPSE